MSKARKQKAEKIRRLIETEGDSIKENTTHFNQERYEETARRPDYEDLRERARGIKEDAIENLPELIDQLRESVEANGGSLYLADDAEDANRYVQEVIQDEDAETMVKSKSMTSEEIEFNEAVEDVGVDVYETDLGEFVVQIADEAPSHLVGPGLHKSREEIADLFNEYFDLDEPVETSEELTEFARDYLGERIREADIGVTGANFMMADSGSIALVTNEGNARKTAVTPDTHIAVGGVEKIIPDVDHLEPFIDLIARAATGQDISQYVSVLTPPVDSPTIDFDNPDEPIGSGDNERDFHLVLIDNGRLDMREDEHLRETLYCIRCGACANSCANFQHVGGHAFGGETYTGGIATGWEAGIYGEETAGEFNDLCTGCSRCVNACPVKIDIPWINTVVRDRVNRGKDQELDWLVEGLTPDEEPGGVDLQKRFFGNFETLAKLGSATAPISNKLANLSVNRSIMDRFLGIDKRRDLPAFKRTTLQDWHAARTSPVESPDREVVLYADVYTNYVQVDRGKAAVRALEALGCRVRIPDTGGSGRAPLSQGMISTAQAKAEDVVDELTPHLDAERDVVVIEPSDIAMFRREYEKLLPEADQQRLADNSYEVLEYIYGLIENGADADALAPGDGEQLAYHSHCQQRTLDLDVYTEAVFDQLDYDVKTSSVECCGMAGSFGYKSEYYDLSMDIGDDLADEFDGDEDRTVVASGTSCMEQLDSLFSAPTKHPIQILAPGR